MSRYLLPAFVLLTSLFLLVLPVARAVTPAGNGLVVAVPWVDSAPTIDGDLSDWPSSQTLGLDAFSAAHKEGPPPYPEPQDASMQLRMVWDAGYLYVAAWVQDDIIINDSGLAVWQDDEIELGFDGNHDFAGPDPVDHQFTFNPDGRITDFAQPTDLLTAVITPVAGGWNVEAAIPLTLFRPTGIRDGDNIGFTFALRDDDDGGAWDHKFLWQGLSTSQDWEQFGALQFEQGPIHGTTVLRIGENGYHAMVDTWINSFQPDANYAQRDVLEARSMDQAAALFYFDLSSLPTGADIEQATFQLHTHDRSNSNAADFAVYGLRRYWDVNTVTWEQADIDTPWGQAGASSPMLDRFSSATAITAIDTIDYFYQWDITPLLKQWHRYPATNFGFLLTGGAGFRVSYAFDASESGQKELRPQIAITYTYQLTTPTPMPTSTPTPFRGTATPTPTATATRFPTVTATRTPTSTPTLIPSPTATPTPQSLAYDRILPIACNATVVGDTGGWPAQVSRYTPCRPEWRESGPEAIYRLTLSDTNDLTATLFYDAVQRDLDLFLLTEPVPSTCAQGVDATLQANDLTPGNYYLVVDGYQGTAGSFTLQLQCVVHFDQSHYLPLIQH